MKVPVSSVFTMMSWVTVTVTLCLLVETSISILSLPVVQKYCQLQLQDVHSWRIDGDRRALNLIQAKNNLE